MQLPRRALSISVHWLLFFFSLPGVAADLRIAATADSEGEMEPARSPGDSAALQGGLARRAQALGELRRSEPLLLVDAGNFLPVAAELASRAPLVLAAHEKLGYDAVNLSYFDLRRGATNVLRFLQGSKLDVVSANLVEAATGKLLVKPFVTRKLATRTVAVLGLTEAPPGLEYLPHVRAATSSIRIVPALEALREWLPQVQAVASDIVLLYHGPAAGLQRILAAHRNVFAAVVTGNLRHETLPVDPGTLLLAPPRRGMALELTTPGTNNSGFVVSRLELAVTTAEDSSFASWLLAQDPRVALDRARTVDPLTWSLDTPGPQAVARSGNNRGARLTVLTAETVESRDAYRAPSGRRLLVLATEWENLIALTLIKDRATPTEYRFPNLADHLYLVVNGARLERLPPDARSLPGHIPTTPFRLERLGSRASGTVIFEVPAAAIETLELRLYDFAHGHIVLPLLAGSAPASTGTKRVSSPTVSNEVLELEVPAFEAPANVAGIAAEPGLELLRVDLRARSLITLDADASAFDPAAKAGARLKVGTVADWKESRRYVQVVADGEIAALPLSASTLPEEPRFLPDLMTGGELYFLVPEKARSLELQCDFPNARSSADATVFRPRGLSIPLRGERPELAAPVALQSIDDDVFGVVITSQRLATQLAGVKLAAQEQLWILGVTVENRGKQGELFQTFQQLLLVNKNGQSSRPDPALQRTPRRAFEVLWIPTGQRRSFDVVFRLGPAETTPRLQYAGVSLAKVLELPRLEATALADAARPATPEVPAPPPAPDPAPGPAPAPPPQKPAPPAGAPAAKPRPRPAPGKATAPEVTADILKAPNAPRGLAGVGLTAEQVNLAIDRAADALWAHLKEKDFKQRSLELGGDDEHVLCALALVHAGAHKRIPELDVRLRGFLGSLDPHRLQIYPAGIVSMLVEAYGDPSYLETLRKAVRYTLEVQGPLGSWSYGKTLPQGFFEDGSETRAFLVSGGVALDGSENAAPVSRVAPWEEGLDGDNSVSQYALLGLHAASRVGVKAVPDVWSRALTSYRDRQGDDGGWNYHSKSTIGYGSMTCAGVCSVAITRHELGEKDATDDPAIWRGVAWLDRNFTVTTHPGTHPPERWKFYYLYSLERVGRVLGLDFIGRHEWYPLGARHLLDTQETAGTWIGKSEEEDPRLATSFALLFLTRATPQLEPQLLKRGGQGTLKTGIQMPPGKRYYFILDASGSMTTELDGKSKWEIAKSAVSRLIDELPDSAEVALRVYGHRKRAIEEGASEDTALEMPLRRLDRKAMQAKIAGLRPRGKTPLARSLLEAARDLQGVVASGGVTVILLTDGGEDTLPRQNPVAAAAELGKLKGVELRVVGFDIGREDWSEQLRAIVQQAQGTYWPARNTATLFADLRSAVFGVPDGFLVLDAQTREAGRGAFGDTLRLPEGKYIVRTSLAAESFDTELWINTDATTAVVFNAARKITRGTAAPGPAAPAAEPAASKPRFCAECGAALKPAANFCAGCGTRVKR